MKLTSEFFKNDCWIRVDETDTFAQHIKSINPRFMEFITNNEYIETKWGKFNIHITASFGIDNLTGGDAVSFHIDNADMDSLANFDVSTLEQANQILEVYGVTMNHQGIQPINPGYDGYARIARTAVPILKDLIQRGTDEIPPNITYGKWNKILSGMIFSLLRISQSDNITKDYDWYFNKFYSFHDKNTWKIMWEKYYDRVMEGLKNFGKYFYYLEG